MEVYTTISDIRHALREERRRGRSIALVPTMGYLHEGHLALMREGRKRANVLVVSIFVNPTQFGASEDLGAYPMDLEGDLARCKAVGAHVVFTPSTDEIYPHPSKTHVTVAGLTERMCGRYRPTHFQGVTTVVTKLFNIIQPDVAIFGEKDYQQLAVIRQMAKDLNMPVEIVGEPTVREADGLAMSSRNAYLSAIERAEAVVLNQTLHALQDEVRQGEVSIAALNQLAKDLITQHPNSRLEYISFFDPNTLEPAFELKTAVRVALACHIGKTRLIDNMLLTPNPQQIEA